MGKKDKLIARLKSRPKDFTFDEAKNLLELLGYKMHTSGKTSGSRVYFSKERSVLHLHKPHPRKEFLPYQIKEIIEELEGENLI